MGENVVAPLEHEGGLVRRRELGHEPRQVRRHESRHDGADEAAVETHRQAEGHDGLLEGLAPHGLAPAASGAVAKLPDHGEELGTPRPILPVDGVVASLHPDDPQVLVDEADAGDLRRGGERGAQRGAESVRVAGVDDAALHQAPEVGRLGRHRIQVLAEALLDGGEDQVGLVAQELVRVPARAPEAQGEHGADGQQHQAAEPEREKRAERQPRAAEAASGVDKGRARPHGFRLRPARVDRSGRSLAARAVMTALSGAFRARPSARVRSPLDG